MFKAGPHSKAAAILSTCTIEQTEQTNKNDTPERILRAVIVKGRRGIQLAGNQRLLTRSKHTRRNPRGVPASSTIRAFNQFESRGRGLRSTSFTAERGQFLHGHLEIF